MRSFNLKKAIVSTAMGAALVIGISVTSASAQNPTREYRDWQQAQNQAAREQREYLRTRSRSDYNQWQAALRRAERQRIQYQRSVSRNGSIRNNGYNNNTSLNSRYRVLRDGSYYETDSRGAELLRTAVNNGYSQGYRQGQIDRQYRRSSNWGNATVYRSGTYGYQSHVARDQYQYYFQQGFQKGYEDGYNRTFQYGTRSGNGFNILSNVLGTILNITQN